MTCVGVLAQNIFGDTRSGSLAGPLGLLVIVLLGIGTALLIRNMNKRLRRLPDRFPDQGPGPRGPDAAAGERRPDGGPGDGGSPPSRPGV